MNVQFLNQFTYWNHQNGQNYTLDANGKYIRYEHGTQPNIVAQVEYVAFDNQDDKYVATILDTYSNKVLEKSKMTPDKDTAFEKLAQYMKERDKSDI